MDKQNYPIGSLVVVAQGEWKGHAGVVSWPVNPGENGYVLVLENGCVAGLRVSPSEVRSAKASDKGFTQLAYLLIKLSSHVIEKAIL